jgi:hypothetical protein
MVYVNLYTVNGTTYYFNLLAFTDGYYRGITSTGEDIVIQKDKVQKVILAAGNNDFYGENSQGEIEGIGYG